MHHFGNSDQSHQRWGPKKREIIRLKKAPRLTELRAPLSLNCKTRSPCQSMTNFLYQKTRFKLYCQCDSNVFRLKTSGIFANSEETASEKKNKQKKSSQTNNRGLY